MPGESAEPPSQTAPDDASTVLDRVRWFYGSFMAYPPRGMSPLTKSVDATVAFHRFSSDWRALVHDITGHVPPSAGKVCHLTGRNAFTGTPGEALRAADQIATECGAPVVYVRDYT